MLIIISFIFKITHYFSLFLVTCVFYIENTYYLEKGEIVIVILIRSLLFPCLSNMCFLYRKHILLRKGRNSDSYFNKNRKWKYPML